MAVTNNQTCEVDAATGSDLNGGWYDSTLGGTDLTQGAGQAVFSFTDMIMDAASNLTFTSVLTPILTTWVGNWIRIPAGVTGFTAGNYKIASVTAGTPNKAVLNTSPAATTTVQSNGSVKLGGSLLTVTQSLTDHAGGCQIWIKQNASDYTSASGFTALKGSGMAVKGYTATRGDRSTQPILRMTGGGTMFTCILFQGALIQNLTLDGNSVASTRGCTVGQVSFMMDQCTLKRFTNKAIDCSQGTQPFGPTSFSNCLISACTTAVAIAGSLGVTFTDCICINCTATGAFQLNGAAAIRCIASGNVGYGFSDVNQAGGFCDHCIAYNNTASGFVTSSPNNAFTCQDCIALTNTAYGFDYGSSTQVNQTGIMHNCAAFNNTTANVRCPTPFNFGQITLSADPFVSAATLNFALNSTAGAGAVLKAVSYPTSFPGTTTSTSRDVGAAQGAGGATTVGAGGLSSMMGGMLN